MICYFSNFISIILCQITLKFKSIKFQSINQPIYLCDFIIEPFESFKLIIDHLKTQYIIHFMFMSVISSHLTLSILCNSINTM